MATSNVTVSVESDLLEQIRAEAEAAGISVSAWMARAARAFARKDRARRHQAWLRENADVAQELADFETFARHSRPGWSSLGEPA
jgi:post-segregation antitoxin (ccd killing protein)